MKRSVAIQNPARLSIERSQLLIENELGRSTVPLEDLAILVLDNAAIDVTGPLLGMLGAMRITVVACNEKHLPSSILLPYDGHSLMAQTLRGQIEAAKPTKKRLWQTIIREKIFSQARLLSERIGHDARLGEMGMNVLSGDTTNREAGAASIYWDALFGIGFRRTRQSDSQLEELELRMANSLVNYGYAVLRASVARAVVMAGLHPALGIHHRHRENSFALADDLMEPLRVLVDRLACDIIEKESDLPDDLTPPLKRHMLQVLTAEVTWNGGLWPLDSALEAYAAQVRSCLLGERKVLEVPGA